MKLEYFTNQGWLNNTLLPIIVTVLAVAIIALINRHTLRQYWQKWSTHRSLNRIGINQISNLRYPDGLGGTFKVDRLVMLHDSILLVSIKPFSGNIYCADNISEWTQLVGQKSFKFQNPLFELESQANTIRIQTPEVPVRGILFFDHSAKFPKGHPDQVLYPGNIPEKFLRSNCPEPDEIVLKAWEILVKLPKES